MKKFIGLVVIASLLYVFGLEAVSKSDLEQIITEIATVCLTENVSTEKVKEVKKKFQKILKNLKKDFKDNEDNKPKFKKEYTGLILSDDNFIDKIIEKRFTEIFGIYNRLNFLLQKKSTDQEVDDIKEKLSKTRMETLIVFEIFESLMPEIENNYFFLGKKIELLEDLKLKLRLFNEFVDVIKKEFPPTRASRLRKKAERGAASITRRNISLHNAIILFGALWASRNYSFRSAGFEIADKFGFSKFIEKIVPRPGFVEKAVTISGLALIASMALTASNRWIEQSPSRGWHIGRIRHVPKNLGTFIHSTFKWDEEGDKLNVKLIGKRRIALEELAKSYDIKEKDRELFIYQIEEELYDRAKSK